MEGTLKFRIANIIANNYYYGDNPTYDSLLLTICENYYRTIGKVPVTIFVMGIVNHFVIKDVTHANKILNTLKEVVSESLEMYGVELTYTDSDWLDLKIVENETRWGDKYILSKNDKSYMSEFFEF